MQLKKFGTAALTALIRIVKTAISGKQDAFPQQQNAIAGWDSSGKTTSFATPLEVNKGGTGRQFLDFGSYLVGAGSSEVGFRTPSEVLANIGALPKTGGTLEGDLEVPYQFSLSSIDKDGFNGVVLEHGRLTFTNDMQDAGVTVYDESPTEQEPVLSFYGNYCDESVRLNNIADPTFESHAANKRYVDEAIQTAMSSFSTIYTGTDAPSDAIGKDGDIYLQK